MEKTKGKHKQKKVHNEKKYFGEGEKNENLKLIRFYFKNENSCGFHEDIERWRRQVLHTHNKVQRSTLFTHSRRVKKRKREAV